PQAATSASAATSPISGRLLVMAGSVGPAAAPAHRRPRGISLPRAGEGAAAGGLYDRPEGMAPLRRWLAGGPGLRARMTASCALVTFGGVIVVEALAGVLLLPNLNVQADLDNRVVNTANQYVKQYEPLLAGGTLAEVLGKAQLGRPGTGLGPGQERT